MTTDTPGFTGQQVAPKVVIDGLTVTPEGWMWTLAFALAGCDWALAACDTPEFRAQMREGLRRRKEADLQAEIDRFEERLAILRTPSLR